ncbi:PD-(D/E)XK nuclease family protein [Candidatus Woesearchaeota archaeon]|nr:PD-(D/E)XK nuclease family protein [Candidatus Woesearchaeota archaeon]
MIKHVSLNHGWFYYYRLHTKKVAELCTGFPELNTYLEKMFTECPNDYFLDGPRSSHLKFNLGIDVSCIGLHEVSGLAKEGLKSKAYKTAHSNVECFMLERDDKTIAVEVPIWLHPYEIKMYEEIFKSNKPLSGHIDILRVEDGKIWIWDYKPKAHREKYADTQTFFYAFMLSKRTGIPLEKFRCGYFDENNAYAFKPTEGIIA